MQRNNEPSLLRQVECHPHRLLFQPTHLGGYDTHFSGEDFVFFTVHCYNLDLSDVYCLVRHCSSQLTLALLTSTARLFLSSAEALQVELVLSCPVEHMCHLALKLPLMVFAVSFSALVVFHPPVWHGGLVVSLAYASTCEADLLPAAISRRTAVVIFFRQNSRDCFLFELLQGHCLESSKYVRCLSEPEAFTSSLPAVFVA